MPDCPYDRNAADTAEIPEHVLPPRAQGRCRSAVFFHEREGWPWAKPVRRKVVEFTLEPMRGNLGARTRTRSGASRRVFGTGCPLVPERSFDPNRFVGGTFMEHIAKGSQIHQRTALRGGSFVRSPPLAESQQALNDAAFPCAIQSCQQGQASDETDIARWKSGQSDP